MMKTWQEEARKKAMEAVQIWLMLNDIGVQKGKIMKTRKTKKKMKSMNQKRNPLMKL